MHYAEGLKIKIRPLYLKGTEGNTDGGIVETTGFTLNSWAWGRDSDPQRMQKGPQLSLTPPSLTAVSQMPSGSPHVTPADTG